MGRGASRVLATGGGAFRFLLASDALMLLSLMIGQVALPWWISQSGGAADLAAYGMVVALTLLVGMPLLSPLGDRHPKRRLIGLGLAAHAVATLGLAAMASAGWYRLPWVLVLTGLNMLAGSLIQPLSSSFASELVPANDLADAISLQQGAQSTGRLIGPVLGGLLLSIAGTAATLWCGGALLAAAAVFARKLPAGRDIDAAQGRAGWWRDLQDGLRANWAIPIERGWTLVNALSWMFLFPSLTMLVPLKVQSLDLSGLWLGLSEASLSLGMLVGAVGVSAWIVRVWGRYATRVGCAVLQGFALALVGFTGERSLLLLGFLLTGLTNSAMGLVGLTHRTLARPPAFRARMFAGSAMTSQVAGSLGPAIAGAALAHGSSVQWIYTVFGLLAAGASLALAFVPGFKAFMALEPDAVEGWYGRVHPEAFPPE